MRQLLRLLILASLTGTPAAAQTTAGSPAPGRVVFDPVAPLSLGLHMVRAEAVTYRGRRAVKLTPDESVRLAGYDGQEAVAVIPGSEIGDGVIEFEMAGLPQAGADTSVRGFLGVAFRVSEDRSRFEYFYLRATNGRAEDQLRRNHVTQYASYPDYPWHRLRREFPGRYESYVDMEAGAWTPVRIVVSGSTARLYVHGSAQPALIVPDLKHGVSRGGLAFWIGAGTEAYFSNVRVSPAGR